MEPLDVLKQHVEDSPLTANEKQVLLEALSTLTEKEHIDELNAIIDDSPWVVPYLYVNFAAKKYAILSDDMDAFRRIVDNEVSVLENLDKGDSSPTAT